jgi:GR25 family glycosyltransferase involved in LPS biosynthesis
VIVTLPRRPDRWEKVVAELARVGISGARKFSAVDGATLAEETLRALVHRDCVLSGAPTSHTQLTRPAIGCFFSHLKIWKRFLEGEADRLVILEDDAVPSPQYSPAAVEQILAAVPADADLLARMHHHGRLGGGDRKCVFLPGLLFQRHLCLPYYA